MRKIRIKLKDRFIISLVVGIIALTIGFLIMQDNINQQRDTHKEIKRVQNNVTSLLQEIKAYASAETPKENPHFEYLLEDNNLWEEIIELTSSLTYRNEQIAKAKALMHFEKKPFPDEDYDKDDPLSVSLADILHELPDDYIWHNKEELSKRDWKTVSILEILWKSFGVGVLAGVGGGLAIFLMLTIIPILIFTFIPMCWKFTLKRISELSKAIQGKLK